MTPGPLKSNVMLFFSLFILISINSNMNLPNKGSGREKSIFAGTRSSERLHIYIMQTQETQSIQTLTPLLPVIREDYRINTLQQEGSTWITSVINTWTRNRITGAIWSNLLLLSPTESAGTLLALLSCSSPPSTPYISSSGSKALKERGTQLHQLMHKHSYAQATCFVEAAFN